MLVSVIVPVFNGESTLDAALASVLAQTYRQLEVCVCDDGSTDSTPALLGAWRSRFEEAGMQFKVTTSPLQTEPPQKGAFNPGHGCGAARNRAVAVSSGPILAFFDADDEMMPHRIEKQLLAVAAHPHAIIGTNFVRLPENSTDRYVMLVFFISITLFMNLYG